MRALLCFFISLCASCVFARSATQKNTTESNNAYPRIGETLVLATDSPLYNEEILRNDHFFTSGSCLLRKGGTVTIERTDTLAYQLRYHHNGPDLPSECPRELDFVDDLDTYRRSARNADHLILYDHDAAALPRIIRSRLAFQKRHAR